MEELELFNDGTVVTPDVLKAVGIVRKVFDGVIKPMFTRNGFNIYPRELERAVCELRGVTEAHVSPLDSPEGETEIVLRYRGSATVEEVRAWCLSRLSAYKQPSVISLSS